MKVWVLVIFDSCGPEYNPNASGELYGAVEGVYLSKETAERAGEKLNLGEGCEDFNIKEFEVK